MPHSHRHHGQQHQDHNQPHAQGDGHPGEAGRQAHRELAAATHEAIGAVADEAVRGEASVAGGPVEARPRGAGITGHWCHLAASPREAGRAGAHKSILQVVASSAMGARAAGTVTDVELTAGACESRTAAARVAQASVQALAPIGTRVAGAPVHFLLTVGACEVGGAFADVAGPLAALMAGSPIEAGGVGTAQGAVLTVRAIVAWGACTVVAIFLVLTASSIATGVAVTLAQLQLTVHTSVARATGASVAPLPAVGAGGPILAWGVVGAIVEILVTEQAAPALVAGALPGDAAGAVATAVVRDTLITQAALPAWAAEALRRLGAVAILFVAARKADR